MIVAIDGIIQHIGADSLVVKVGPISLEIHSPTTTLEKLGSAGDTVSLYPHLSCD